MTLFVVFVCMRERKLLGHPKDDRKSPKKVKKSELYLLAMYVSSLTSRREVKITLF